MRLALAWLAVFAVTWRDWLAMAAQWWNISTYNHILFVPVIVAWLAWSARGQLSRLTPQAWWPGLVLFAGALFIWLVGSVASVNLVSQLGAVLALQTSVLALLGPRIAWAMIFPLCYMLFLVPFGDELVPALQMVTARIVIALTGLSGIEAHIEGVFIDTPAGLFEVAEACSGVQFLVAMVALGTLVCALCFRSWKRRIVFMAAAIALPILANGIRAWATVYVAQFAGIEAAAGFDHIVYGWFFFAFVVAILLAGAWRWFDRAPDAPLFDAERVERIAWLTPIERHGLSGNPTLAGIAGIAVLFALWAALAMRVEAKLPETVTLGEVPGWTLTESDHTVRWEPRAAGAQHRMIATYRAPGGAEADVFLALYPAQDEARDASAYGEGAVPPGTPWRWLKPGPPFRSAQSDRLFALQTERRLALTSYRHGDLLTGSPVSLKLATIRDRLLLRPASTAMLVVSVRDGQGPPSADIAADFLRALGDRGAWIDRIAAGG